MFQDDFILRHIRLFVLALARVLGLIKQGDLGAALEVVRTSFQDFLGMSLDDFLAYPDDRLKDFLYFGELSVMGLNKVGLASALLLHAGRIYKAKGSEAQSLACFEKTVRLLLDVTLADETDPELPEFSPGLDEILEELTLEQLANDTLMPLAFYFDRTGALGRAHEAIQILLGRSGADPDIRDMARSFYDYVLDLDEESLRSNGLLRDSILGARNALAG